jgi:hypothetical protein
MGAVLRQSCLAEGDLAIGLAVQGHARHVIVQVPRDRAAVLDTFEGEAVTTGDVVLLSGPTSPRNAAAVRERLSWLAPRPLELRTSAGLGDRLGLATPGHIRALRAVGGRIAPVFAQQSIREMTRTGRTPQEVIDAATWGALEQGWREPVGADADHLKSTADIDRCAAAGFSLFTIDPGEFVDGTADQAAPERVRAAVERLPWTVLADDEAGLRSRYVGRRFEVGDIVLVFSEPVLLRAAMKYGRAIAHVATLFRHLAAIRPAGSFELEVSVDETDAPTSHAEHLYIAAELRRLGVVWVSLAPRFVGRFEKGVDYIGSVEQFTEDVRGHAAIARQYGPYKLSLHSGSDKFSIYPAVAAATGGLVHLKTAGTSYLEALRAVALSEPSLFREIYAFACERYETDRASYHVSAEPARAPSPAEPDLAALASVLDQFDARQILHVTFGSVLTARAHDGSPLFAGRLRACLAAAPEAYAACLERHFVRHLSPFVAAAG